MATVARTFTFRKHQRIRRKGVHAKSKNSKNKHSKMYKKPYKGQGR